MAIITRLHTRHRGSSAVLRRIRVLSGWLAVDITMGSLRMRWVIVFRISATTFSVATTASESVLLPSILVLCGISPVDLRLHIKCAVEFSSWGRGVFVRTPLGSGNVFFWCFFRSDISALGKEGHSTIHFLKIEDTSTFIQDISGNKMHPKYTYI